MRISKITCSLLGLFLLCFNLLTAQLEISEREAIALLELKSKTKGHLWTNQWDEDTPISEWHGVTIKNGKVVGLDLSNNNLQGKIPITIGNLKNLESLNLSKNNITGKIPGLFRKFKNLKEINLGNNNLVGNIPSTINKLQNLKKLDLCHNKLEGKLPENVRELSKLNTLALADNNLSGEMPVGMENLKQLKKLYLSNNSFSNMNGLRELSRQQLVMTDFQLKDGNVLPIDFTKSQEGLSKLEFEDYED
jgi:Leucine-rich repeat (LRR) protein